MRDFNNLIYGFNFDKFKSRGLHDKHSNLESRESSQHLLQDGGKQRKSVCRVGRSSGPTGCVLSTNERSGGV